MLHTRSWRSEAPFNDRLPAAYAYVYLFPSSAKKVAQEQGGTIKHEFTLIKAFTYGIVLLHCRVGNYSADLQSALNSQRSKSVSSRATPTSMSRRIKKSRSSDAKCRLGLSTLSSLVVHPP
jgi:hypothetical protein